MKHALVFLNPVAGQNSPEDIRQRLEQVFHAQQWDYRIHEFVEDDVPGQVTRELDKCSREDVCLIVAAGGDGTVSLVADGLLHRKELASRVDLGILPLGTANLLARELGLPLDVETAVEFLVTNPGRCHLDAMLIGDRYFLQRVGIGFDAATIRDTSRTAKRWFGRLAYLASFFKNLLGYGGDRYYLQVDGQHLSRRAYQVMVANAAIVGMLPLKLGPAIDPTDSHLDLCIFNVRRLIDYPALFLRFLLRRYKNTPNMKYYPVRQKVTIGSKRPVPVQADGEYLGETPVTVELIPRAIKVVGTFQC